MNIFLPFCGLSVYFFDSFSCMQKHSNFIRSHFSIFVFIAIAFEELAMNYFPRLMSRVAFPKFFPNILIVLGLMFKYLIQLELGRGPG